MSSLRRPPFPLVVKGAFFAGFLVVPLTARVLRPAVAPPETPAELVEQLRQDNSPLHIIWANSRSPENGVYICERPQSPDQLRRLLRQREYADRWRGVVYCERTGGAGEIAGRDLAAWGEHGMRVGPLLFFGDPRLLAKIAPLVGAETPYHWQW